MCGKHGSKKPRGGPHEAERCGIAEGNNCQPWIKRTQLGVYLPEAREANLG